MKRWPIVRHVRYLWMVWRFWRWWTTFGHLIAAVPNEADLKFLEAVWEGRA